ncbi:MAG: GYF domain-containing protein [Akkermansiaceae bacterium]|jgi:hypothetical protein|nr:GYF domain-containing protein [Akkermansiaceae bacterium]
MNHWYYSKGGQQFGPVPESELLRMASSGEIQPATDLVWREGMNDWQPATQALPSLAASPGIRPNTTGVLAKPAPAAAASNPYAAPIHFDIYSSTEHLLPPVKPASFLLGAIPYCLGILGILGFYGWFIWVVIRTSESPVATEPSLAELSVFGIGLLGSFLVLMIGYVIALIHLHRAWVLLQPNSHHSTPGRAVGFLFIPFYNLYWVFVAYWRWAQDWNRLVAFSGKHPAAPKMSEGIFLTHAILFVASGVLGIFGLIPYLVFHLIVHRNIAQAINYAARGNP